MCSKCEPDELAVLERLKSYRTYDAGEAIVWAGEETAHLGSVTSSVASLNRTM